MRMPWRRRQPLFTVRSMQVAEPVFFDLMLRRTPSGYQSQWRVDYMPRSSAGATALVEELARALPEILRQVNRTAPSRPEIIHVKIGMY